MTSERPSADDVPALVLIRDAERLDMPDCGCESGGLRKMYSSSSESTLGDRGGAAAGCELPLAERSDTDQTISSSSEEVSSEMLPNDSSEEVGTSECLSEAVTYWNEDAMDVGESTRDAAPVLDDIAN